MTTYLISTHVDKSILVTIKTSELTECHVMCRPRLIYEVSVLCGTLHFTISTVK